MVRTLKNGVIGTDNVYSVSVYLNDESSGICRADGKAFGFGERVHLDSLDGLISLDGVKIEAFDKDGNTVFERVLETASSLKWNNWEIWTMTID